MLIFHVDKQPLDRFSKGSAQKYIFKMHFMCGEQHIFYLTLGAFLGVNQEFRLLTILKAALFHYLVCHLQSIMYQFSTYRIKKGKLQKAKVNYFMQERTDPLFLPFMQYIILHHSALQSYLQHITSYMYLKISNCHNVSQSI